MKVSIITPTYNSERYIKDALESIKAQTYPDIEHIIMDNLSTDNTRDICSKYNNKFFCQKDISMYDALNNGILKSTGNVLAFLNSDDLYQKNNIIEKIVDVFRRNEDADVVYGNCEIVDRDLKHLYTHRPKKLSFEFAIKRVFVVGHPAVFVKKDVFLKYGLYDLNLKYMSDCEYWIRLLKQNVKFEYCDRDMAAFRRHGSNLSLSPDAGIRETKCIMNKYGYKHNEIIRKGYLLADSLSNFGYFKYLVKRKICEICGFIDG